MSKSLLSIVACFLAATAAAAPPLPTLPTPEAIDAKVRAVMTRTQAQGLALAVIDGGKVQHVQAWASATPPAIRCRRTP